MIFTPVTEEELQKEGLCKEGIFSYEVIKSEDRPNKQKTNIYTAITLKVWDNEGAEHLVFTNMAFKKLLKHFCDVNGMQTEYNSGNLPPESFMHKSGGRVIIGIEGEKQNPEGGVFKAKNIVKDYIVAPHGSILKSLPEVNNEFNDDIPF